MPEHFTRNTVSAEAWCAKCQKRTQHRIDDRRIGPCLDCLGRLEARHQSRKFCECGRIATALCDWRLTALETCNRSICPDHAKFVSYGSKALCPEHQLRWKEFHKQDCGQGELFKEAA